MRIGLDFGTTNSGAAVFDGKVVHPLPLDPGSHDPSIIRSTLYVTRDQQVFIGREAIDAYYEQNTGRPTKLVRQYVGWIEESFGDVGAVKGYPVSAPVYVRDVYVLIDELTPGRLLHSLKSELAGDYEGTTIFGQYYELEELIATYLGTLRRRAEADLGEPVDGVVLGRPVTFVGSRGEAGDRRAEDRLRRAAEMAGFHQVGFELEPVAAALHYELMAPEPQTVVVFDFGGGTLDVTVMRTGGRGRREVFATGGVGLAGNAFDRRIVEGVVLDHFGRGTTWGNPPIPFPRQYTQALLDWQAIAELNRPETLHFLQQAQLTASHPVRIHQLQSLLINNYAMQLVDAVEQAKVDLSSATFATIRLTGEDLDVWQPLTRSQFEALISSASRRVEACVLDTLDRSGLSVDDVDTVIRTGGSCQIPAFVTMMERIFGPEKVVLSDVFGSVMAGLAISAGT